MDDLQTLPTKAPQKTYRFSFSLVAFYDIIFLMRTVIKGPNVTWIDLLNPNQEDIRSLQEHFALPPLVLEELTQAEHHPRLERRDHYLYLVLYYPVHFKEKRETRPREIDFVVSKDILLTSHYGTAIPIKALLDVCNLYEESRKTYLGQNAGYLLSHLLISLWKNCIRKLNQIDTRIDEIEKNIFAEKEREMVREISFVKTDIINFWRILEPQGSTVAALTKEAASLWGEELLPYFEDVANVYAQAWNTLKTHRETILALEATNQSLLTTKTNEIIRVLTVFSVLLLPLTLLASIWGMNTYYLPFRGNPIDFWIIFSLMATVTFGMVTYFRKKGWM
jgi:magnesium transporter